MPRWSTSTRALMANPPNVRTGKEPSAGAAQSICRGGTPSGVRLHGPEMRQGKQ